MRVRITQQLRGSVDGIDLTRFLEGLTYEVGTTLGNYLLAQQWAEPATEHEPAAILPLNRTIHRPSVLVVDDDEDMRQILLQLLEYQGWPVHTASDGLEALRALHTYRPSLILLDLAMPRMNGIEFRASAASTGGQAARSRSGRGGVGGPRRAEVQGDAARGRRPGEAF